MGDNVTIDKTLFDHLMGNMRAAFLVPLAYMKQNDISRDDYIKFYGELLSKTWVGIKGQGARALLDGLNINMKSLGSEVTNVEGDENSARATYGAWIPQETLDFVGVTEEEYFQLADMFGIIAESLDLKLKGEYESGKLNIEITK